MIMCLKEKGSSMWLTPRYWGSKYHAAVCGMCGGVGHRLHASQVFARGALGHHVALHRSWKSCMPDLAVPMPQHRRASAPSVFGTKECQAATFAQHHVTHCVLTVLVLHTGRLCAGVRVALWPEPQAGHGHEALHPAPGCPGHLHPLRPARPCSPHHEVPDLRPACKPRLLTGSLDD